MAKRYFQFPELYGMAGEEMTIIKPSSTLGRHHMMAKRTCEDSLLVIGVDSSLTKTGISILRDGDVLAYDCGDLFVIRPTTDPIKLLKRRLRLSDIRVVPHLSVQDELEPLVDIFDGMDEKDISPYANRSRFWGNGERIRIYGEFFVAVERLSFRGGVDQRRRLSRIYLLESRIDEAIKEVGKYL